MILCVNPNAAIDKTVLVPNFSLNGIHRPQQVIQLPGGKGCNVARTLKVLGQAPVMMSWVGGHAGEFIKDGLAREGIGAVLVRCDFESRTCLSILDPENRTLTELYEQGEPIPAEQVAAFVERFKNEVPRYSAVTLSGSLPPGVPRDFYAELIRLAREAHVPTLLDTGGDALRLGIAAQPTLIKPNQVEFDELLDAGLSSAEYARAIADVSEQYGTMVVVSFGKEGVIAADRGQVLRVRPPRIDAVSAVGSGDALLAGLAFGLVRSFSLEESLRHGVAAAAANTLRIGAGVFAKADFNRLLAQVTVSAE